MGTWGVILLVIIGAVIGAGADLDLADAGSAKYQASISLTS